MAFTCKQVRDAIVQLRGEAVAEGFEEDELKLLYEEGYKRALDLRLATRQSLLEMGLRRARVDALLSTPAAGLVGVGVDAPEGLFDVRMQDAEQEQQRVGPPGRVTGRRPLQNQPSTSGRTSNQAENAASFDDPVHICGLLREAGVPENLVRILTAENVRIRRIPAGLLQFVLRWGGVEEERLEDVQKEVERLLEVLSPTSQANMWRNNIRKVTPFKHLHFVGRCAERIEGVFALLYNQLLGFTDKPYILSCCQQFGSGKSEYAAHLADLLMEDWRAVLDLLRKRRPGNLYGEEGAILAMLSLGCALHVYVMGPKLDDCVPLALSLAREMHRAAIASLEAEDTRRGLKRGLNERELWARLEKKAGLAVPTMRSVIEAVQELCGSVFWTLDEVQGLEVKNFSTPHPGSLGESQLPPPPPPPYSALQNALQPLLNLKDSHWAVVGRSLMFSEIGRMSLNSPWEHKRILLRSLTLPEHVETIKQTRWQGETLAESLGLVGEAVKSPLVYDMGRSVQGDPGPECDSFAGRADKESRIRQEPRSGCEAGGSVGDDGERSEGKHDEREEGGEPLEGTGEEEEVPVTAEATGIGGRDDGERSEGERNERGGGGEPLEATGKQEQMAVLAQEARSEGSVPILSKSASESDGVTSFARRVMQLSNGFPKLTWAYLRTAFEWRVYDAKNPLKDLETESFQAEVWRKAGESFQGRRLEGKTPLERAQLSLLVAGLYGTPLDLDGDLALNDQGATVPIRQILDDLGVLVVTPSQGTEVTLTLPPIVRAHLAAGICGTGLEFLRTLLKHSPPGLVDQGTVLEYAIREKTIVLLRGFLGLQGVASIRPFGTAVPLVQNTDLSSLPFSLSQHSLSPLPRISSANENTRTLSVRAKAEGLSIDAFMAKIQKEPMRFSLNRKDCGALIAYNLLKDNSIGIPASKSASPDVIMRFTCPRPSDPTKQERAFVFVAAKNFFKSDLSLAHVRDEIQKAQIVLRGCQGMWDHALLLILACSVADGLKKLTGEPLPLNGAANSHGALWPEKNGLQLEDNFQVKIASDSDLRGFLSDDYHLIKRYSEKSGTWDPANMPDPLRVLFPGSGAPEVDTLSLQLAEAVGQPAAKKRRQSL